jgi:hypothetical protein
MIMNKPLSLGLIGAASRLAAAATAAASRLSSSSLRIRKDELFGIPTS